MNKISCQKCGFEVSSDFGHRLAFCTNCSAARSNLPGDKTLILPEKSLSPAQSKKGNFLTILLTSLTTAVFLSAIFAAGIYFYFSRTERENSVSDSDRIAPVSKPTASLTPRKKSSSPISAAEITNVEFNAFEYDSRPANYSSGIQANRTTAYSNYSTTKTVFAADGTATKISTVVTYDANNNKSERATRFEGAGTKEQFARLAAVLVKNDFLNEPDSKEIYTDSNTYALKIAYAGGEKKIATSNSDRNTPETAAILQAFRELQNRIEWKEAK